MRSRKHLLLLLPVASAALAPARQASRWTAAGSLVKPDGWRLALDIGREAGTSMPAGWAASGCRLPLVFGCDFEDGGRIAPKSEEVRFTGPDGEVVSRVEGGGWTTRSPSPSGGAGATRLSFALSFPEELQRRDVTLGGTVRCEGVLYSTEALRDLDDEYYAARNAKWEAGKAANEAQEMANAPKKWNDERKMWERRYEQEGLPSRLFKRAAYLLAERRERSVTERRPLPKELSMDCGPFPGIEGGVYVMKGGRVYLEGGLRERLVGTWSMEPINDAPVSYRGA